MEKPKACSPFSSSRIKAERGSRGYTHKTCEERKEGVVVDGEHVMREPWIYPEPSIGIGNPLAPEHRTCDHAALMSLPASRCRLLDPLLRGEHWRQLASECSAAIQHMHTAERTVCPVHKFIARGRLVLAALFNLVHDISMDRKSGHLNWVAIKSLVQYFTPSLVTKPFIPGLTTEGDCHFHPMMLMTCYYWPEVRLWCYHLDQNSIISSTLPSATTPPSKKNWSFHSEIKQQNSEGKQLFFITQDHSNRKDKLLISPEEEDFELRIQQKATRGLDTSVKSDGVQIISGFIESTGRLETSRKPEDDKMVVEFIESTR
uniref:Uncharacterized protein n=1 Tax=Timema poppense TaxID=170557 RepID=A0A7R9CZ61_TIMPO|nr:unnamed protein product [Timema poppensis]